MSEENGVRMTLDSDAWHQGEDEEYYVDCPECGSPATVTGITEHGRCNGYLERDVDETELDETAMSCGAQLSLELVYESDAE